MPIFLAVLWTHRGPYAMSPAQELQHSVIQMAERGSFGSTVQVRTGLGRGERAFPCDGHVYSDACAVTVL